MLHQQKCRRPKNSMADDGKPPPDLSCDSCGWVIKPGEVYAEKYGEITCEHCLEAMAAGGPPKELH